MNNKYIYMYALHSMQRNSLFQSFVSASSSGTANIHDKQVVLIGYILRRASFKRQCLLYLILIQKRNPTF